MCQEDKIILQKISAINLVQEKLEVQQLISNNDKTKSLVRKLNHYHCFAVLSEILKKVA